MAARILDKFDPADEGSLYGTTAEAEAALEQMIKGFKARGYKVSETEDEDGSLHSVEDQEGRPVGIYYVHVD